jgi:hypothetical protein
MQGGLHLTADRSAHSNDVSEKLQRFASTPGAAPVVAEPKHRRAAFRLNRTHILMSHGCHRPGAEGPERPPRGRSASHRYKAERSDRRRTNSDLVGIPDIYPYNFIQMTTRDASDPATWAPQIRGQERQDLVDDLARGDKTHAMLADKFSRSLQAIRQFSARNSVEIAQRRQMLLGEVSDEASHMWVSDKVTRIAWRLKWIEDLDAHLADPDLDPQLRSRYTRDAAMLLRAVAEELGELRTQVDVDTGPTLTSAVIGWDIEKWAADLAAGRTDPVTPEPTSAPASEPARSSTPTPAPAPAPAPERDGPITYGAGSDSGSSIFRSMSF